MPSRVPQFEWRGIERQASGLDLREVEDVVDQLQQRIRRAFTIPGYSRCCAAHVVSSVSSVIPMMPFIGVLISWLMLARNSLFARLPSSALSFAVVSSVFTVTSSGARRDLFLEVQLVGAAIRSRVWISSSISLNPSTSAPTSSRLPCATRTA